MPSNKRILHRISNQFRQRRLDLTCWAEDDLNNLTGRSGKSRYSPRGIGFVVVC